MTNIPVYDDTAKLLDELSDKYDLPIAEIIEMLMGDEDSLKEALGNE